MENIGKLLHNRKPAKQSHETERGMLYDVILGHLNPSRVSKGLKPFTHPRLAYLLTGVPTKDIYALISKCDDAERRGYPWSAIFHKEITPTKTL